MEGDNVALVTSQSQHRYQCRFTKIYRGRFDREILEDFDVFRNLPLEAEAEPRQPELFTIRNHIIFSGFMVSWVVWVALLYGH